MDTTQKTPLDRSRWGSGPWDGEPDRVDGEAHGFPTIARRGPMGTWCGYVAVPPGHPAHSQDYNDVDVDVHGGLTYADQCHGDVCHVPKPGEPDDVWWLGFDCGHAWDVVPEMLQYRLGSSFEGTTYKDLAYVQAEIVKLAEQLARMR